MRDNAGEAIGGFGASLKAMREKEENENRDAAPMSFSYVNPGQG